MKKKRKPLTEEQIRKIKNNAFRRKLRNVFINAGFEYINTTNKNFFIGHRDVEIDHIFFYENILLICEDTATTNKKKDHIRNKKEAFDEINANPDELFDWLYKTFPEKKDKLQRYNVSRYQIFNIYISQTELELTNDDKALYSNIKFIDPVTLNYFHKVTQSIKLSSRYEIFRFLGITRDQLGLVSSESPKKNIRAPIIYPKDYTGLSNNVRVVSFMMSAESLLNTCYVLRKDNWDDTVWLYQRLIQKERIKKIRSFLAKKGEAFYNNIIVSLPDNVTCHDLNGNVVNINELTDFEACTLEIPDEMNSICVIDGQHRIFAHYEGDKNDKDEEKISQLRKQLHLLVTGLIFPKEMSKIDRTRIESEIFLDINSNSKPVPADVLLHINMIKDPFSDIGLARRIIEKLNKEPVFLNMFELSSLDESKIKVASIVKFALRYLVTINPVEGKDSFYTYWKGNKAALEQKNEDELEKYIMFCTKNLSYYFSAIKNNFQDDWFNPESKLLSVTSLNGFIIAYNRQLKVNGINNFEFFDEKFKKLHVDFSKENFAYTSSQYRKFSDLILKEAFGIDSEN